MTKEQVKQWLAEHDMSIRAFERKLDAEGYRDSWFGQWLRGTGDTASKNLDNMNSIMKGLENEV